MDAVIKALERLQREHRKAGDACYYDVRDRRFNPRRAAQASGAPAAREALVASYGPDLAAMLIFLNRTGFNGLFRLNRQGGFNVPAGRYAEPRICDPDHLRAVAEAFGQTGLTLELAGFETTIGEAGPGRLRLLRPALRAAQPDRQLRQLHGRRLRTGGPGTAGAGGRLPPARAARPSWCPIRAPPDILDLYSSARARAAGLVVRLVPARRAINSRSTSRGPINEVIVTNVRLRPAPVVPRPAMLRARGPPFAQARFRSTLSVADDAKVAELADAPDLGSGTRKGMWVRVPPFAPSLALIPGHCP